MLYFEGLLGCGVADSFFWDLAVVLLEQPTTRKCRRNADDSKYTRGQLLATAGQCHAQRTGKGEGVQGRVIFFFQKETPIDGGFSR